MNNKNNKLSGIQVVRIGYVRAGWSGRVEHIFYDFLHLTLPSPSNRQTHKQITAFHLLAISLKPTNKSLPPQTQTKPKSNASISLKPTNSHKPKPIRKEERTKERVEERAKERERERENHSILSYYR
jgi:hypothetical protein